MQGLRDVEVLAEPGCRAVFVALALQQAAVDQHAHRLDGIQGNALRTVEYPSANLGRIPGARPVSIESMADGGERLQEQRGEVPLVRGPPGMALGDLGAAEREDEQRVGPRPVEEVFDEVDERRLGPLHVLEHEHDGIALRHAFEEQPGCREQFLSSASALLQPSSCARRG